MAHKFNLVLIIAACAVIASLSPAWADPCTTEALSSYDVSGFSCTIGDKIFSNFSYTANAIGDTPISDSKITVAPVTGPNIGLEFSSAGWAVGPGQTEDSLIKFAVNVIGGANLIEDAAVAQLSSAVTGDGLATITEGGCGPSPCTPGVWTAFSFKNSSNIQQTGEATFATVGSLLVSKDINVKGNTTGIVAMSDIEDTFSQIPEPRALSFLLGLGLIAGLALRKKFQSARS